MTFLEEVQRRRTFAIISHPDAGKTTLYLTGWKSKSNVVSL